MRAYPAVFPFNGCLLCLQPLKARSFIPDGLGRFFTSDGKKDRIRLFGPLRKANEMRLREETAPTSQLWKSLARKKPLKRFPSYAVQSPLPRNGAVNTR